jgi:pimeloyl-ACP methyl ester carboxylesterase
MADELNILQKDWSEVRKMLKNSKSRGGDRSVESAEESSLRNYLGDQKFDKLRNLAARGDEIRQELKTVILIPGIMGSSLVSVKADGDEDTVWLSVKSLAFGGLRRLELNDDGKTNRNGETIKAPGVFGGLFRGFMFDYYSLALETLQAEPFSYDWRLDVRTSARQLADVIQQKLAVSEEKISLVAHSMGGLVARSFIQQFPDLWKRMKGNLIMLGTPNHGSFDAVQALIGKNRTIQKLDSFDIFHRIERLMEIFSSFPGLYQLLPEKSLADPRIYQRETWSGFPSVKYDTHFLDVEKFHQELTDPLTIDAERMFYIAGTGFKTLDGLRNLNNGEFEFTETLEGDGTVSHRLGELSGIRTFYDDENEHSDLLNGEKALEAVKSLINNKPDEVTLETDKTKLRTTEDRSREVGISSDEEDMIDAVMGAIRAGDTLEPELLADAERKVRQAIWGSKKYQPEAKDDSPVKPKKVKVELSEGDISNSREEIIAVGKYSDLPPRGACSAIDQKLNYRISLAHQTGMIGSELGQLFFIPALIIPKAASKAKTEEKTEQTIILAGAGSYGKFKRDDLRFLVMNIAFAVLSLGKNRFGMVLIGTGLNDFSIDRAVRSVLSGIADAVDQFPDDKIRENPPPMEVVIFEKDGERFGNLKNIVKALAKEQKNQPIENVKLNFDEEKNVHLLTDAERAEQAQKAVQISHDLPFWVLTDKQKNVTRVTVERDYEKQEFSLSALTSTAAIPTRQIPIQNCVIDSLVEKIRRSGNAEKQKQYGRLLHSMLIPEDFQGLIDTNKPLVLLLDSSSASIPWEMLSYGGMRGFSTFGVELQLSRQFSMSAATVASVSPPVNDEFKVLIIADPAEGDLHLDGAAREGRELKDFFEELNRQSGDKLTIKVDSCIGSRECDIVDVLTKIFTVEYDLIHFSGHGHYDKDDPTNSGWVFGSRKIKVKEGNEEKEIEKLLVISPREIFRLRKVPRLVFANACFTSQVADGNISINQKASARETTRQLSGIAEAFFARGIENYIGAGWQVNDSLAVNFAKTFYEHALSISEGQEIDTLSVALSKARAEIKSKVDNTTWGAYQHYGDANTKFIYVKPKKKDDKKGKK